MINYNILFDFGIKEEDVSKLDYDDSSCEEIYYITLKSNQRTCPYCKGESIIKEYKEVIIKAKYKLGKTTIIIIKKPRYVCTKCKKTYTQNTKIFIENRILKTTINLIKKDFYRKISFTEISKKYDIPLTDIIRIFDNTKLINNAIISEAICIDEFKNCKHARGKYACIIVNFDDHKIVDILEDRRLVYLREYFDKIPVTVRKIVKYVVCDMYDGYITIAHEYFPNAIVAIDPYHYMEYMTNAVQKIRKNLFAQQNICLSDRNRIADHWQLVSADTETISNMKCTLQSGITISYSDRILKFVKQDKKLFYAYVFLQEIYEELKRDKDINPESTFNFIINKLQNSIYEELQTVGNTWNHYKQEIINSFIKYKGKRLSNGPIEGINNTEKTIIKFSYGLRSYERLKKRLIMVINFKNQKG